MRKANHEKKIFVEYYISDEFGGLDSKLDPLNLFLMKIMKIRDF